MKHSQFFSLAAMVYIAPHMHPWMAAGCGVVALIFSWLAHWKGE